MNEREQLLKDARLAIDTGDTELEAAIYKKLDTLEAPKELPAVNRFLSGVGGKVLKDASNVVDILPANPLQQWLSEQGKSGLEKATGTAGEAGQFIGDSAKYMMLSGSLPVQSIKTGLVSAATVGGDITDRLVSGVESGIVNLGAGKILDNFGNYLNTKKLSSAENARILNANNVGRIAAQQAGMNEGFVNSPSEANPTVLNNLLESIAGKAAIRQETQLRNAHKSTLMTRRGLGLADDTPLDDAAFKSVLEKNYKPYQDIAKLPTVHVEMPKKPIPPFSMEKKSLTRQVFNAKDDLEALKIALADARELYRANYINPHPETMALLKAERKKIATIEARFNDRAIKAGRPEMIDELMKARENIAKVYTAKGATNKVTGMVDARDLGKRIDKEKPLTGEMRIAGEFEQAFPNAIRDPEHVPSPNVNQLMHAILPVIGGSAGAAVGGVPGAIAGGVAAEMAPRMAKALLLSKPYQKMFAKIPVAEKSKVVSIVEQMINNDIRKRSMPMVSNLVVEAFNNE